MVDIRPSVHSIVVEASSSEDKKYMKSMSKNDVHQINATLIQNLYESTLKRKNFDYGHIPDSKGDIDKVKHIEDTIAALDILQDLYSKNNITDDSVSVVKNAISNVRQFKLHFVNAFQINNEVVIILYNSIVMSIMDATSMLIANYTTYIMGSDPNFSIRGDIDKNKGVVSIKNLRSFNSLCDNGTMAKGLSWFKDEHRKNLAGEEIIIAGAILAVILSIVPLCREIVYFFYYSRVKMSDILNMQADFLEMNKLAVEASSKSPSEKKNIIKKQQQVSKKMRKTADKLMINNVDTNDVAKKEIKDENSLWSLNTIEKQINKNKMEGSSFRIV